MKRLNNSIKMSMATTTQATRDGVIAILLLLIFFSPFFLAYVGCDFGLLLGLCLAWFPAEIKVVVGICIGY